MTSILKADRVQSTSNGFVLPPAGGIIQIQYSQKNTNGSITVSATTHTKFTDSDLAVSITPISTSSVIKIEGTLFGEFDQDENTYNHIVSFYRDNTRLGRSNDGNRPGGVGMLTRTYDVSDQASTPETGTIIFYDTPSTTSAVTYTFGLYTRAAGTYYINRTVSDSDHTYSERAVSSISVMEIAG